LNALDSGPAPATQLAQQLGFRINQLQFLPAGGNFYAVKNNRITSNSATIKAREKISSDLEYL